LQFALDLDAAGASPEGVIDEGTMPATFIEGAVSMIAVSSGNLTNIHDSVDFDFGVCLMPACATEHGASIGGGGDLYMIKSDNTTQEQYDAAWKFIRFLRNRKIRRAGA
jgi:sn-glycerol 3-phosphate transport system substrate-binding protein